MLEDFETTTVYAHPRFVPTLVWVVKPIVSPRDRTTFTVNDDETVHEWKKTEEDQWQHKTPSSRQMYTPFVFCAVSHQPYENACPRKALRQFFKTYLELAFHDDFSFQQGFLSVTVNDSSAIGVVAAEEQNRKRKHTTRENKGGGG